VHIAAAGVGQHTEGRQVQWRRARVGGARGWQCVSPLIERGRRIPGLSTTKMGQEPRSHVRPAYAV
jgi:hypothetical protein